ncbi:hypothetical protein BOX15_Mlig022363g3 [Macrostomum lignano]|uniref:NR LBD domain-containing protein n=1 Tax=Macrostomum lignano TaxID=282301 RepID=A0A267FSA3_9PLAT|nr:hypothetical protein BOX15_Mlig022363g3 [Macrostomum lignano]
MRRPRLRQALLGVLLRGLQRLLQADGAQGFEVHLPGRAPLLHRQAAAEPLPILPLHEVPGHGHEARGRSGGASARQGARRGCRRCSRRCAGGRRRLHGFQRHRRVSASSGGGAGGLSFGDPNTPASVGGASGVGAPAAGAGAANGEHGIDVQKILNAELALEPPMSSYVDATDNPVSRICQAADKQLMALVNWAKQLPHFCELP